MEGFKIIIMELMDFSLFNYLCKMPGYCVPEITARKFTQQIALGLLYMHEKGLAHRDLKPENILMKKIGDPEEFELKLCDFGFASKKDALKTQIGTYEYMAPEIMVNPAQGRGYGAEVDLWALGCVVYFMLCGSLHIDKYKGRQIMDYVLSKDRFELPPNRNFSEVARSFVSKLLTKVPRDRMTFEMLRTHPFLASSMHFTLFISLPRSNGGSSSAENVPTIHNIVLESSDIFSTKISNNNNNNGNNGNSNNNNVQELLWRDVAAAFMDKARTIPGVSRDQQLLIMYNGNSVAFDSPIKFSTNNYRAIEAFVFMNTAAPAQIHRGFRLDVPIMDINKLKEIRGMVGASYDYVCAQREAMIFRSELISASERYEEVMGQWKSVKQAISCTEQVCSKYVTQYVEPAVARAELAVRGNAELAGKIIFNIPIPTNTVEDIDKLFNTEWNEFLSRISACTVEIDSCLALNSEDPNKYGDAFRHAEEMLAKYPVMITNLYTSFFVIWNVMCKLFVSIRSIFDLSQFVGGVRWDNPADAAMAFMDYNHKLSKILADNPSWSTKGFSSVWGVGPTKRNSQGDTLLMKQLAEAQRELAEAQKRILELQTENEKLKSKNTALEQLYVQAESYLKDTQNKKI